MGSAPAELRGRRRVAAAGRPCRRRRQRCRVAGIGPGLCPTRPAGHARRALGSSGHLPRAGGDYVGAGAAGHCHSGSGRGARGSRPRGAGRLDHGSSRGPAEPPGRVVPAAPGPGRIPVGAQGTTSRRGTRRASRRNRPAGRCRWAGCVVRSGSARLADHGGRDSTVEIMFHVKQNRRPTRVCSLRTGADSVGFCDRPRTGWAPGASRTGLLASRKEQDVRGAGRRYSRALV